MTLPSLTGATRLVPILAHPVDHVQAPRHYNPAFAEAGLDWHLLPLGVEPARFDAALAQLAALTNLQGLNLTMPHKTAAHAACARHGPEARRTGVVNTMRLGADGRWEGESFDGIGFLEAAVDRNVLDFARPVVVFGAGGAGKAIAFALAAAGVHELHVVDVTIDRAKHVVSALRDAFPALLSSTRVRRLDTAGLVVNATPLGLHAGDAMPFEVATLAGDAAVFDIVAVRETELMAAARARRLAVVDGVAMIQHQIAVQIAFWRGEPLSGEYE